MNAQYDPDDLTLAAEYVLRLLDDNKRQETHARVRSDPAFAALVMEWRITFGRLDSQFEDETPNAAVKTAVMLELFGNQPQRISRFWERLKFNRSLKGLAVVAVVLLAFTSWQLWSPNRMGPLYVAEIATDSDDFKVAILVDAIKQEVTLTRVTGEVPEGRILQVWAHGPDKPAQSVGLWTDGVTVRLSLPPEIAAVEGTLTVGVSEEPTGGSLTGSPSGRVFGTVDIARFKSVVSE